MPERKRIKADPVLLEAVEVAREAAVSIARPGSVGEHLQAQMIGERLATHRFRCEDAGYSGWMWEVSVARVPRSRTATVCEVDLAPGPDVLLAPAWVPWADRLRPGDVSREDVLPFNANDPRLIAGFEATDQETMDVLGIDQIGYGRARVLSQHGLDQAAERWYASERGPTIGAPASATCATCGFLMKMSGTLGQVFGICANEWAQDDGSVVALEHACGAHSETDTKKRKPNWPITPSRIDDDDLEIVEL